MTSSYDRFTRWLTHLPLTITFCAILAIVELDFAVLPDETAAKWTAWASTNYERLNAEPFGPMLTSPFIVLEDKALWLVMAVIALAIVETRVGWAQTLGLIFLSHVLGTLVSEGIVWWREGHGLLPSSVLSQIDVGVSYIVVGALTAGALVGRPFWLRIVPVAALVLMAPDLLDGLDQYDVSAVGHVTAFCVAGIVGVVWLVKDRRRRLRNRWLQPIKKAQRVKKSESGTGCRHGRQEIGGYVNTSRAG